MDEPRNDPKPFVIAGVLLALACIVMARLPESFVATFYRSRPFSSAQSGWAYRLLVVAAVVQAAYVGFVLLRPERLASAGTGLSRAAAAKSAGRLAAVCASLTLVYGIASFFVTGQRGGFWLFPLLMVAQLAWYYRQVGEIVRWLAFQPEVEEEGPEGPASWNVASGDFVPPLARGLPGHSE